MNGVVCDTFQRQILFNVLETHHGVLRFNRSLNGREHEQENGSIQRDLQTTFVPTPIPTLLLAPLSSAPNDAGISFPVIYIHHWQKPRVRCHPLTSRGFQHTSPSDYFLHYTTWDCGNNLERAYALGSLVIIVLYLSILSPLVSAPEI
jgi:hypothetical protein